MEIQGAQAAGAAAMDSPQKREAVEALVSLGYGQAKF